MNVQYFESESRDLFTLLISNETAVSPYEISQIFDILSKEFLAKANQHTGEVNGGDQTRPLEESNGSDTGGSTR